MSNPPDYSAFQDACDQLTDIVGQPMFDRALSMTGQVCSRRAQVHELPTAAARALFMMKLCLIVVPEADRRVTVEHWKDQS